MHNIKILKNKNKKTDQSSKDYNMIQAYSTASRFFLNAVQCNPDAHPIKMLKEMTYQGWFNDCDIAVIIKEMKSLDLNIPKSVFQKVH